MFWRRLDRPGHEAARLVLHPPFWQLTGTAVFGWEGEPCRLEYQVTCDEEWLTRHAQVGGWIGGHRIAHEVTVAPDRRWRLDGRECPAVAGCADIDLSFSPATNLLPIRRLRLEIGAAAPVRAAWLRFPECTLEPLEQRYHRGSEWRYHYESGSGEFRAELGVSPIGFVIQYPGLWQQEL
jgi:uncharacterized protein